jgi:chromosome segregation ATPase
MADSGRNLSDMEAQIIKWSAELGTLAAKAERKVVEAKQEYYEEMERLRREIERKVKRWAPEAEGLAGTAAAAAAEARQAVERMRDGIDAGLRVLQPEIEGLKKKASAARAEAKRALADLSARREAARERVKKLKGAGDEAWGEVRAGVERAWGELKAALENAVAKFK